MSPLSSHAARQGYPWFVFSMLQEDAKCILEALSQSLNISILRLKDWKPLYE